MRALAMTGIETVGDDLLDEFRIRHAGYAALGANHGGDALQRHHSDGAGLLGDLGLLHVHHVHDDAALQHLGEADLQPKAVLAALRLVAVVLRHVSNPPRQAHARLPSTLQFNSCFRRHPYWG